VYVFSAIHTFGARNDNLTFHDYFDKFFTNVFFPYLKENNITHVIQLGDLFDRRKYINFVTLYKSREYFFDKLVEHGITMDVFVGNHDTAFKNTNKVNSPELLLQEYDNITVHSSPADIKIGETTYALLPWVCQDNYDESLEYIKNTKAHILLGHLELAGFKMYKTVVADHGTLDVDVFKKFDIVCSGHYHHKSSKGNIHYLGTPYELTWSDYNDERGFHIFDDQTRELTFVKNPYMMFHKINYDDNEKTLEDLLDIDYSIYNNTYCKVIVRNKTNPYWFDMFISKLQESGVNNIQIVEDHLNLSFENDEEIVNEADDTISILKNAAKNIESSTVSDTEISSLLMELYDAALNVE